MNQLERAQCKAYGRYLTANVMKNGPAVNIRSSDANRNLSMMSNYKKRPVPTRYTNNDHQDRNIALFNTRSNNSLFNYEENGNMDDLIKLRKRNESKITTLNEDLLPNYTQQIDLNPNSLDRITNEHSKNNSYFPHLAWSETNKLPANAKPTLTDDRMLQHTSERDFMYGDNKVDQMRNMLKNPSRWDKLERQAQAERKGKGMGQPVDRWVENSGAYVKRPLIPVEYVIDDMKKRIQDSHTVNDLDNEALAQHLNRVNYSTIYPEQLAAYELSQMNHIQSGNNDIVQNRYFNNYDYGSTKNAPTMEPFEQEYHEEKGMLSSFVDAIKNFFGFGTEKETIATTNYNKDFEMQENYEYYPDTAESNISPMEMKRITNDKVYAIRDGSTLTIAPETIDTYGSTFVSPISRVMCLVENGELYVIQKFDKDRILGSDLRPIGDDLIVTVLPEKYTDKIRDRIHNSEGRMFKELNSRDFAELIDMIASNPDMQYRVKQNKIEVMLRDSDIDKRMLQEFTGDNIMITDDALQQYFNATNENRIGYDKLGEMNSNYKYDIPENINDFSLPVNIDGQQSAEVRSELKERNVKYGGIIDERELDLNQVLPDTERGMSKTPEYRNLARKDTNFSKFRYE